RQFQDALLKWSGSEQTYLDFIKETWNSNILNGSSFNQALHDGVFSGNGSVTVTPSVSSTETQTEAAPILAPVASGGDAARALASSTTSQGLELTLYSKVGMGDGQQANNPWLQEFPDPISRVSWDNYLTVSAADAESLGLKNEHVANGGLDGSYA